MKTTFRMYPDGELIALFPEHAGDPEGKTCVAYMKSGGYHRVDPRVVIKNTKPAPEVKHRRLKREIEKERAVELEVHPGWQDYEGAERIRAENPHRHKEFDRVARHFYQT